MELVGKQLVDFPDRQSGEQIKGVKLHFLCSDDHVEGQAAMTQFIRADNKCYAKALNMPLGDFNFLYGPKGRVVDVMSVESDSGRK